MYAVSATLNTKRRLVLTPLNTGGKGGINAHKMSENICPLSL